MKTKYLSLSNLLILLLIIVGTWLTASQIKPFLHYNNQQIGFSTDLLFFKSFLVYPGGISDYIANFISQFFKFNTFGSILIVAVASLQGFFALNIVSRLMGKTKLSFTIFASILLFGIIVFCDYRYPYYISIRLLIAFIFTWIFVISTKNLKGSIYVWPVLALLLFYISSGPALIVFAVSSSLILIYTHENRNSLIFFPLFLLFAGLIPYLAFKFIFPSTLANLYAVTEIKPPEMLAYSTFYQLYIYYLLLPVILLSTLFLKLLHRRSTVSKMPKSKVSEKINFYKKATFILSLQAIFIAALGYFIFINSYDSFRKKLVYIEYYAENENWKEILEVAETIKVYDFRVNYQINRAYYHLGQLPEKLFNYPQLLGSKGLFFDTSSMNGSFTMPISDLYFDLGFMSESLHWAFEAQTLLPNSPRILKRIIMIYLVNEKYVLAEKFLNVLDGNLLYRDWVSKYRKYIHDNSLADKDPLIAEKRLFSPRKSVVNLNPMENLMLLLETNKNNRMAYEYLLTLSILDSYTNVFIDYIKDYSYYNIKTLPNSWSEALSFYIIKNKNVPDFVTEETVSQDCIQRLRAFNAGMSKFKGNKEAAQNFMRQNFENSYWYYLVYLNPKVTNVLNNKSEFQ